MSSANLMYRRRRDWYLARLTITVIIEKGLRWFKNVYLRSIVFNYFVFILHGLYLKAVRNWYIQLKIYVKKFDRN